MTILDEKQKKIRNKTKSRRQESERGSAKECKKEQRERQQSEGRYKGGAGAARE